MRNKLINLTKTVSKLSILSLYYISLASIALLTMQVAGASIFHLRSPDVVGFINYVLLYISENLEIISKIVNSVCDIIYDFPILKDITGINLIIRIPSLTIGGICKVVFDISPKLIYQAANTFIGRGLGSLILSAPVTFIGYRGFKYTANYLLGNKNPSELLYNSLSRYENKPVIGYFINELKLYKESKSFDYLNKKLDYYKKNSLTPIITGSLSGFTSYYLSSMLRLPIIPALAAGTSFLIVKNNSRINNQLDHLLSKANNIIAPSLLIGSIVTPFVALYKSETIRSTAKDLLNIAKDRINTDNIKFSSINENPYYIGSIASFITRSSMVLTIGSNLWFSDPERGKLHRIFNTHAKAFAFSTIPAAALIIATSFVPSLSPVLGIALNTCIEAAEISVISLAGMCMFDKKNISKAFSDVKNSVVTDNTPLTKDICILLLRETIKLFGAMSGFYIGYSFPMNKSVITNLAPSFYDPVLKSSQVSEGVAKIVSSFIGMGIGTFASSKVASTILPETNFRDRVKAPQAPIAR